MEISYGGLSFRVVNVNNFERAPVLDESGTDYLFTRFQGNITAIVNSQPNTNKTNINGPTVGMGFNRTGKNPNLDPIGVVASSLSNPPITDVTIRHWLTVPRRTLVISDGPTVLLQSPRLGRACDSHNGPFIDVFSIQNVLGQARTYIVNFQFTTYINECEEAENKLYVLLSNRFSQRHELDEDYGLTVITEGSAYFRTDLIFPSPLLTNIFPGITNFNPDLLREILFLPIPIGFKRNIDFVRGRADSSVIDYGFRDIQTPQQFVVGDIVNATRIEANYKESLSSGEDLLNVGVSTMEKLYNFKWSIEGSKKATVEDMAEGIRKHRKALKLADEEP